MKLVDIASSIFSATPSPIMLRLKKQVLSVLLLASWVMELSEQCMQTPQGKLTSEVIGVGPGSSEVISVSCACPSPNCGFVLQNDAVTQGSFDGSQQIFSVGSCACANGQTENCYPANTSPDTSMPPGSQTIIDLSCPTPSDFCVCSPTGECFTTILDDSLSDLFFYPYQDAGGCNVYVSPSCFMPGSDDNQNDGLKSTTTATQFTCNDATTNPTVGSTSSYIKVLSASCAGCGVIAGVTATNCGSTSSFAAATPIRKKRDL